YVTIYDGIRCLNVICVFFSSRRRHTRSKRDWSSDVCSSDLVPNVNLLNIKHRLHDDPFLSLFLATHLDSTSSSLNPVCPSSYVQEDCVTISLHDLKL